MTHPTTNSTRAWRRSWPKLQPNIISCSPPKAPIDRMPLEPSNTPPSQSFTAMSEPTNGYTTEPPMILRESSIASGPPKSRWDPQSWSCAAACSGGNTAGTDCLQFVNVCFGAIAVGLAECVSGLTGCLDACCNGCIECCGNCCSGGCNCCP